MSGHALLLVTVVLYGVGAVQVLLQAITRRRLLTWGTTASTLLGFAVHTASLSQRWSETGQLPVAGAHDASSFLSWAVVLAFLLTYLRTRMDVLGLVVHPVAFGLVLAAALSPPLDARPIPQGLFLPLHVTLAFFGYGPLFVASAMGVLYLIQERELRSRAPRRFYYLVPSLERCDTVGGASVQAGFGFLTLAIVTGLLWNQAAHGRWWTGDGKQWLSVLAWGIYVSLLVARHRSGWGGRRAAWLGIAGFASVLLALAFTAAGRGPGIAR